MSERDKDKQEIIPHTSNKEVSDPINEIDLSSEQIKGVLGSSLSKIVADNIPVFNRVFAALDRVDQEVRNEKLAALLSTYAGKFESLEVALNQLKFISSSRSGMIIFQKVVHILDNGTLDDEWIETLSNILNNVTDEEIEAQFEERSYLLAQIARLTPQALLLINKSEHWHTVKFQNATTTSKQTLVGDWDTQVTEFFARNTSITDEGSKLRIAHAFRELEGTGMIYITESKSLGCTQIGARIQQMCS